MSTRPTKKDGQSDIEESECRRFVATTHFEAVQQVQAEIGLDAIVVNTRTIPAKGLARLWKKPQVELLVKPRATKEPTKQPTPPPAPPKKNELLSIYGTSPSHPTPPTAENRLPHQTTQTAQSALTSHRISSAIPATSEPALSDRPESRCESFLRRIGLDELLIASITDQAALEFASHKRVTNRELLDFCHRRCAQLWQCPKFTFRKDTGPIVLLGAPGVGKTTLIGKWASLLAFRTQRRPRLWKLDGHRANTDQFLDLIAELHQLTLHRFPEFSSNSESNETVFIDIPGADWNDPIQMKALGTQLDRLPPRTHYLVINAAYDTDLIKRQIRAYAAFPIDGLILTHLDEEKRWNKILNITVGTNFPLTIVSGGQNIPGYFQTVDPTEILAQVFPSDRTKSANT